MIIFFNLTEAELDIYCSSIAGDDLHKHSSCFKILLFLLCPNFKDLQNNDKLNYLLNSDGPIVKMVAKFFYLASLIHSSVNVS